MARLSQGLESLRAYRVEWDERARAFKKKPEHNWASHGADAWALSVAVLARPDARAGAQEVPIGISMSDLIMDQFVDLANAGSRQERFTRSPRAEPRERRQIGPYPAQDGRFEVAKKPA